MRHTPSRFLWLTLTLPIKANICAPHLSQEQPSPCPTSVEYVNQNPGITRSAWVNFVPSTKKLRRNQWHEGLVRLKHRARDLGSIVVLYANGNLRVVWFRGIVLRTKTKMAIQSECSSGGWFLEDVCYYIIFWLSWSWLSWHISIIRINSLQCLFPRSILG